jgi:hypothetical protein
VVRVRRAAVLARARPYRSRRTSALCLAPPEVTARVDGWAQSFDIGRRSFCLLVAREDPAGKPVPLLVLRADPDEREALLSIGRPFFASRAGRDRIGGAAHRRHQLGGDP